MTWTDIPDASLDPGKPARAIDAKALRDNIAHVRDGNNLVQVFTASGTYTKPAGLKRVKVTVVGGGGNGGGASANNAGGGGGGGGASIKVIEATALGATETVTVGGAAGTSSFGAHCSATGGASAAAGAGAAGGIGSGGNTNIGGGGGGGGGLKDSALTYPSPGGSGGSSIFGGGGHGTGDGTTATNGQAGRAYGGGGSGAGGTTTGGSGSAGIVIVEEFY